MWAQFFKYVEEACIGHVDALQPWSMMFSKLTSLNKNDHSLYPRLLGWAIMQGSTSVVLPRRCSHSLEFFLTFP